MKRFCFAIAMLVALTVEVAAACPLKFPGSEVSRIGIYVENLSTGKIETAYNADMSFTPASVMKCITSATAQISLRPDFCFKTTVRPLGYIASGILHGDLLVTGSGDPTLGSRHFPDKEKFPAAVISYLRTIGVDSIQGDVIIDDTELPPIGISPFWLQEDIAWEYGAGLFGINYRDNSFPLTVRADGENETMSDQVEVVNRITRGKRGNVVAMRGYDSSVLTLYGTITSPSYTARYSMPSPSFTLYRHLLDALDGAGVAYGGAPSGATEKAAEPMVYRSPVRDEILRSLMVHSNNLFAEGMLRATVLEKPVNKRGIDDEVAAEIALWQQNGLCLDGCRWQDGCGLSPVQKLTPHCLGNVLSFMAKSGKSADYVGLFPRVGVEGTVRPLLAKTPLSGKLALKSGTMNSVVCYAGYKLDGNEKPTHVVVIMVNGFGCSASAVRKGVASYLLSRFN